MTARNVEGFETPGEILGRLAAEHMARTQESRPTVKAGRLWTRTLPVALLGGIVAYGLIRLGIILSTPDLALGLDYSFVMGQAHRILEGGPVYQAWELTSPIHPGEWADLYPPTTVFALFVPMSFLPAVVWWVVPLTVIGWVVWHHRPTLWAWVVIAALFVVWPHTWTALQLGNTVMWISAAVALGTVYRWPAAFVLLKPTLAPFALLSVRSKAWWVVVAGMGAVSLLLIPAWLDYLQVLRNLSGFTFLYSMHDIALPLIPVVAWASRRQGFTMPLIG